MITNGSAILKADLDALTTSSLSAIETDNAQLPLGHYQSFWWHNLTAGLVSSNPERAQCVYVVPWDCYVESIAVYAGDFTNPSDITVSVVGDGALPSFPLSVSTTVASASHKASRLLYDGTKGRVDAAYLASNRALRLLNRGATVTVSVTTTSVSATNVLEVVLALRSFWGRP